MSRSPGYKVTIPSCSYQSSLLLQNVITVDEAIHNLLGFFCFDSSKQQLTENSKDKTMIGIKEVLRKASILVGMVFLLGVISSQAAPLAVTTTADAGFGSLRQAIIDATINVEANIVTFNIPLTDSGYNAANNMFTINLLSPLPDIPLAAMTLNNNQLQGIAVNGNNTFRIFTLVNSAVVTMNNLTISQQLRGA